MSRIWSEEGKLARWLEVELAALDGWAEVGAIPAEDVAAIRAGREAAERRSASPRSSGITDHDTAAFVDAVTEQLGPEGRWLHYGLTSSDVVDTALALQIQDAGQAAPRRARPRDRRRRPPRRGAPPHDLHRPHARHPRRADDVRLEARGLGLRARPRPGAARARARVEPRRPALGHRRHATAASTPRSSGSRASGSASSRIRSRRR